MDKFVVDLFNELKLSSGPVFTVGDCVKTVLQIKEFMMISGQIPLQSVQQFCLEPAYVAPSDLSALYYHVFGVKQEQFGDAEYNYVLQYAQSLRQSLGAPDEAALMAHLAAQKSTHFAQLLELVGVGSLEEAVAVIRTAKGGNGTCLVNSLLVSPPQSRARELFDLPAKWFGQPQAQSVLQLCGSLSDSFAAFQAKMNSSFANALGKCFPEDSQPVFEERIECELLSDTEKAMLQEFVYREFGAKTAHPLGYFGYLKNMEERIRKQSTGFHLTVEAKGPLENVVIELLNRDAITCCRTICSLITTKKVSDADDAITEIQKMIINFEKDHNFTIKDLVEAVVVQIQSMNVKDVTTLSTDQSKLSLFMTKKQVENTDLILTKMGLDHFIMSGKAGKLDNHQSIHMLQELFYRLNNLISLLIKDHGKTLVSNLDSYSKSLETQIYNILLKKEDDGQKSLKDLQIALKKFENMYRGSDPSKSIVEIASAGAFQADEEFRTKIVGLSQAAEEPISKYSQFVQNLLQLEYPIGMKNLMTVFPRGIIATIFDINEKRNLKLLSRSHKVIFGEDIDIITIAEFISKSVQKAQQLSDSGVDAARLNKAFYSVLQFESDVEQIVVSKMLFEALIQLQRVFDLSNPYQCFGIGGMLQKLNEQCMPQQPTIKQYLMQLNDVLHDDIVLSLAKPRLSASLLGYEFTETKLKQIEVLDKFYANLARAGIPSKISQCRTAQQVLQAIGIQKIGDDEVHRKYVSYKLLYGKSIHNMSEGITMSCKEEAPELQQKIDEPDDLLDLKNQDYVNQQYAQQQQENYQQYQQNQQQYQNQQQGQNYQAQGDWQQDW